MKKFLSCTIILILLFCVKVSGQDYTFSNHNIVPFSLNPALAGNANAIRIATNYRQQWMNLGNRYHTARISYDQNFYKQMCSLGFAYTYDNMSNGIFQTNEFALVYSHNIRLSDGYFIRLGIQGSLFLNYFGYGNLIFEDQYDPNSGSINPTTLESFENDNRIIGDFSAGIAFVMENKLTIGFSANHLSEPDNGFIDKNRNKIYRKYVAHINYVYDFKHQSGLYKKRDLSSTYLFINANYQHQYNFNAAYLGAGVAFKPLILGIAYKSNFIDSNIASAMVGVHYKGLQLFYICDFNVSTEGNGTWAHELSLIYVIKPKRKDLCPVVYW